MDKRREEFQNEKESLFKECEEISTQFNIPLCAIVYEPEGLKMDDASSSSPVVETWPPNSDEVRRIIDLYRDNKRKRNTEQKPVSARVQKAIDRLPNNAADLKRVLHNVDNNIKILGKMIEATKAKEAKLSNASHHISLEASVPMLKESPPSDNSQVIGSNTFFLVNPPLVSTRSISINNDQAQGAAPTPNCDEEEGSYVNDDGA